MLVTDKPSGKSHYHPNTRKCSIGLTESRILRLDPAEYFNGKR